MHIFSRLWIQSNLLIWCSVASSFSLGRHFGVQGNLWGEHKERPASISPLDVSLESPGLYTRYENALSDLQKLESEPICHRIAAKLLVNSCQVLDGHDEATAITDTGHAARDFVDFYAASLAICDLERGSFNIPHSCSSFRESTLQRLPTPKEAQLHVTSDQINNCLQGLAKSDSAWNTWISYRHKALGFCEAARRDHEKDQEIRLYQRLTKILESLTSSIESDIAEQLRSLDRMFHQTASRVEEILPHFDRLKDDIVSLKTDVFGSLTKDAKGSAVSIRDGLKHAEALQDILETLVNTMQQQRAELISTHDSSVQASAEHLSSSLGVIVASLSEVAAMSNNLQDSIDHSSIVLDNISRRQADIESGMNELENMAGRLSEQQKNHQKALNQSQTAASAILDTLESVSSLAGNVRAHYLQGQSFERWLPLVVGPGVALVLGSYGLPPSICRNLLLMGLGETLGVAISAYNSYGSSGIATHETPDVRHPSLNETLIVEGEQQLDYGWDWETC